MDNLISSLEIKPNNKNLIRTNESVDEIVLRFLLKKILKIIFMQKFKVTMGMLPNTRF